MTVIIEKKRVIPLSNLEATEALGANLATQFRQGLVFLRGPLGAGKTTLVRGWLRALGYDGPVKSPTFTLVEPYEIDSVQILHFDLFRIANPSEIEYIGMLEHLETSQLQFVEWPERGENHLPDPDLDIQLEYDGPSRQAMTSVENVKQNLV
ncbi:MAG: tRNA (adenosine(37)-N6)-threonylcarbamoyltransferase complex ATPase subunit type 1 TsaE [Gammaproteobacteria bacterium]|nr:tRNA (adenosine(37)-N6)-threonylcarbamoyltransferase complex ATPase subunit type 1 TsaE [Gammaproteobacteria bacterium]MYF01524.1 tRNA (adenosine(37)-N6)-threonylcarbamoyltransferase complex ATPase subunit type 1 TsaE [Gammaproteobacteria bacterium]MYI77686.1 tRNA (adenosine(37)-N6)-threonylcarbamoyltransferase complex ATPase subunit type 1 TsaE [Gammaproteobacteria bacterium]